VRRFLAFVLTVFSCIPASAAGYDNFSRALAAFNRGDNDLAISEFSNALSAGDLNPGLVPLTYLDRGVARLRNNACADAAGDLTNALTIKPNYLEARSARVYADTCLGKYTAAVDDLDAVNSIRPQNGFFRRRASLHWKAGDFPNAAKDLQQAVKLEPKDVYAVLWLEVMLTRAGAADTSQVASDAAGLDARKWPVPLIDLYLDKLTLDDVNAVALKGDSQVLPGQRCEADFYTAEWLLARQKADAAKPLFQQAVAQCPPAYFEYDMAEFELKQLH